jgi:acetolactate synthase I/II/III large subunit
VNESTPGRVEWLGLLDEWTRTKPLHYHQPADGPIKPQHVIEELHRITDGEAIVVSGVGQHQMWASQYWQFGAPRSWVNSGGLGTMGFAVPAAIGAKVGRPGRLVYAIDGDGCFQMTMQELLTAVHEQIPIKVAILNNRSYGMVQQWQDLFYGGRRSATHLGERWPDYPALAESLGCAGLRADHPGEVATVIEKSLAIDDRPVVTEFVVDPDEMVWPMVIAGGSNDQVLMGPDDLAALNRDPTVEHDPPTML